LFAAATPASQDWQPGINFIAAGQNEPLYPGFEQRR